MKTKYRTNYFRDSIETKEFDITKETDSYFWVGKTKYKKSSTIESFFDTFEEAQQYLIEETEKRIENYKREIQSYEKMIDNAIETMDKIKDLKPF